MSTRDIVIERIVNMTCDLQKYQVDSISAIFGVDIRSEDALYELPSWRIVDILVQCTKKLSMGGA